MPSLLKAKLEHVTRRLRLLLLEQSLSESSVLNIFWRHRDTQTTLHLWLFAMVSMARFRVRQRFRGPQKRSTEALIRNPG